MEKPEPFKSKLIAVTLVAVLASQPLAAWGGTLAGPILNEGLTVDVEDLVDERSRSGNTVPALIEFVRESRVSRVPGALIAKT